ncbi:copper chaperone PCu(A)C [Eionea flava]
MTFFPKYLRLNIWHCLAIFTVIFFTGSVIAQDTESKTDNTITIGVAEPRVNTTALNASTVYMQIINYSQYTPITLVSVSTDIADKAQVFHPDNTPLTIAPQKAVNFSDEEYNIQLHGLTKRITKGDKIPLTLTFAHGDSYIINAIGIKKGSHYHETDDGYTEHDDH